MVSADGFTKVLDFGLAKLTEKRDSGPDITQEETLARDGSAVGSVVGTAGYMSPEQVSGKAVDHRSDIFSFGCILYEAATRRKPFAAETGIETMHKILNEKPVPVEELNDKAPAELRRLVKRCLAKSPDQRVQSIKDLAIELREIVEEYDTLSASASSSTHASGAAAAQRLGARLSLPLLAGAGLLAAIGLAAGVWALRRGAREAAPPAFQTMRMSTQTSRGDVVFCTISPDGRYIAYLAGESGRLALRVRQVATGSDVEVLPARDALLELPAFSPDGNYLFYLTRKPDNPSYRALFQVPSLGGTPRERVFDVDSRVSFSPDGRQIVFWRGLPQTNQFKLLAFDLESSQERELAMIERPEVAQAAAWSPDGSLVALLLFRPAPDLETTVALFDAASGARRDLVGLPRTILTSLDWLEDGRGLVTSGQDLRTAVNHQVFLIGYPEARVQRVTNDFNHYSGVSVSKADEAIAAVRLTRLANLWVADAAGGPVRQLTSTANPEASVFGITVAGPDTLVFDAPRDQAIQTWAIGTDGGEPRPLTSGTAYSLNPAAAGDVVVFDRLDASGVHIWRMALDGSDVRKLTSGPGEQVAALSPDGRHLAFAPYDTPRTISLLELATGQATTFASEASGVAGFSPDGTQLLLGSLESDARGLVRTVWNAYAVPGGELVASFRLPPTAFPPAWGPDGKALSYRDRGDPAWNVYRKGEGDAKPLAVTRFDDGRVVDYAWSRDGSRLAVTRRTDGGSNVWVSLPDGSRAAQVTQFAATDVFDVRWLPDNRRLALTAGKLSRDVVLIRSFR